MTKPTTASLFEIAVKSHNANPTAETVEAARNAGFEAISAGIHDQDYVAAVLADMKKPEGIIPPYDVAGEALKALKEIAFLDKDSTTTLDEIISDARNIISKGVMLEPSAYSFIERRGTPEEAVLLTLSSQGFFFAGDVPMNDLSQRFIMLVNNNLTQFYDFHYERGYGASMADGDIPTDIVDLVKKLIPAAHRSHRNKDKFVVKEAKAFIKNIEKD